MWFLLFVRFVSLFFTLEAFPSSVLSCEPLTTMSPQVRSTSSFTFDKYSPLFQEHANEKVGVPLTYPIVLGYFISILFQPVEYELLTKEGVSVVKGPDGMDFLKVRDLIRSLVDFKGDYR